MLRKGCCNNRSEVSSQKEVDRQHLAGSWAVKTLAPHASAGVTAVPKVVNYRTTRPSIDYRFTVESWWRTGDMESTLGIALETSFTYLERGDPIVIQTLEERCREKSYRA